MGSASARAGRSGPLRLVERPVPEPGPGQLLLRIRCCGVCRTDLHLAEGDLPPKRPDTTPGHEVVGRGGRDRPGHTAVQRRRPGRGGLAGRHRRVLRVLPPGPGEPLPGLGLHRLGLPRRLRRVHGGRRGLRPPAAARFQRRGAGPAAVRRASSATGRCAGPRCRRAARSASGGSAAPRTSPPRSPWPRAPRCTSSPGVSRPGSWPVDWASRRRRTPSTRRRCRWTRRSCSPRSARWCRPR